MNATKAVLLLVSLVAVLIGYRVLPGTPDSPATVPPMVVEPTSPDPVVTNETEVTNIDQSAGPREVTECLTLDQVRAHPIVRQLMSRLDAAAARGVDIEIYRGLDESEVLGYAEQGDSAAMVVTGAILALRAYDADSSRVIEWLTSIGHLDGVEIRQQMSSDASLALNDAAHWFYQAALNGRLMALPLYGQVRSQLFGGAVGLGWISREEYDSLDPRQKKELLPQNMYHRVARDMIPGSVSGFIQGSKRLPSSSEIAERVRNDIHHEFNMALSDSDLPLPITAAGDPAEFEKLRSQICDSEVQRP